MWTCWKALLLSLSDVMIKCECFNDWDYSLLVLNEVFEPYLSLWIDCHLSIRNHMIKFIYIDVIRMIMMPSCPYFIFIDISISKHVEIFFDIGFRLRTSEVSAWGSWYVHFASYFSITIYCIMGCYYTLCKSHGDLHLSFLYFILWQAPCVGKILIYIYPIGCIR